MNEIPEDYTYVISKGQLRRLLEAHSSIVGGKLLDTIGLENLHHPIVDFVHELMKSAIEGTLDLEHALAQPVSDPKHHTNVKH